MKTLLKLVISISILTVAIFSFTACDFFGWFKKPCAHENTSEIVENRINATCTEAGSYDLVVICDSCSAEVSREKKTDAPLGHDISEFSSDNNATCEENGTQTAYCQRSGCSHSETREIEGSATGHDFDTFLRTHSAATCEKNRFDVFSCSKCSEENIEEIQNSKSGHKASSISYTGEYCGVNPLGVMYCEECGEFIGNFGHKYECVTIKATCSNTGSKIYTCSVCEDSYTEVIAKNSHFASGWIVDVENSCTDKGHAQKVCLVCNEVVAEKTFEAEGHLYSSSVIDGKHVYECHRCEHTYSEDISETVYTVSFETNGGESLEDIEILEGEALSVPTPEKEGHIFLGWYYDEALTEPYSALSVNSNITLYAKWETAIIKESDDDNIIKDAATDYAFVITSDISLNSANINNYVKITDSKGNIHTANILSSEGKSYEISCDSRRLSLKRAS